MGVAVVERSDAHTAQEAQVLDAVLTCLGRFGVSKTTLDDVAREAGMSRATVYRVFPGGKVSVLERAGLRELGRLLDTVRSALAGVDEWHRVLAVAITTAHRFLGEHPTLRGMIAVEPDAVSSYVAFDRVGPYLSGAVAFLAPYLQPGLSAQRSVEAAEWGARILLSFVIQPQTQVDRFDLRNIDQIEQFILTYLAPGVWPSAAS